jgi:hypothetical protein
MFATVVGTAAFLGLGMSMPACPGQQEMKDQLAALQQTNDALVKRVGALEAKVGPIDNDMVNVKKLLQPMGDAIQAQKAAMDTMNASLTDIQAKMAKGGAKAAPTAKGGAKKRK